jgi:hydrogenase nickel incorporation protein HypA/HybF
MHEVDMTRALVNALQEWHDGQSESRPVTRVVLEVGLFTAVEPGALRFAFDVQRRSVGFLTEAELDIREIPLIAYCRSCKTEYRPEIGTRYAHECGMPMEDIRSGRELRIATVEMKEIAHA